MELEQIIKAWECCALGDCYPCPYSKWKAGCRDEMCGDALSLIKELTEENEAWQKQLITTEEQAGKAYYDLACEAENLRNENANLHASCTELTRKCASLTEEKEYYRSEVMEILGVISNMSAFPRFESGRKMEWSLFTPLKKEAKVSEQIAKEMVEGEK